jgi:hypothetical protein
MLTGQSGGTEINAWLIVELTDDLDRIYHLEMIEPVSEPSFAKEWEEYAFGSIRIESIMYFSFIPIPPQF